MLEYNKEVLQMKKILTFLLLAVLLCIPLTTQAAVEDPAIILEDPARPQYKILEDPAIIL